MSKSLKNYITIKVKNNYWHLLLKLHFCGLRVVAITPSFSSHTSGFPSVLLRQWIPDVLPLDKIQIRWIILCYIQYSFYECHGIFFILYNNGTTHTRLVCWTTLVNQDRGWSSLVSPQLLTTAMAACSRLGALCKPSSPSSMMPRPTWRAICSVRQYRKLFSGRGSRSLLSRHHFEIAADPFQVFSPRGKLTLWSFCFYRLAETKATVGTALADDFDTPQAIQAVMNLVYHGNRQLQPVSKVTRWVWPQLWRSWKDFSDLHSMPKCHIPLLVLNEYDRVVVSSCGKTQPLTFTLRKVLTIWECRPEKSLEILPTWAVTHSVIGGISYKTEKVWHFKSPSRCTPPWYSKAVQSPASGSYRL